MRAKIGGFFAPVETALGRASWLVAVITTLVLFLIFFFASDTFNWASISNVFTFGSILGIMVVGIVILMVAGEFDLSAGSAFAVVGFTFLVLLSSTNAAGDPTIFANPWIAAAISIVVGALLGLFNGAIVVGSGNPSFIITLGTLLAFRGLARAIGDGQSVFVSYDDSPPFLLSIFNTDIGFLNSTREFGVNTMTGMATDTGFLGFLNSFFGIIANWRTPVVWFIVIAIIFIFVLHRTRFGNRVFSVGGNRDAAQAQGVSPKRIKLLAFILVGVLVATAAVIDLSERLSIAPRSGQLFELFLVAGCVMGGARLKGGFGTVLGAVFGIIMISLLREGLPQLGFSVEFYLFAFGTMLILVAALNQYLGRANS